MKTIFLGCCFACLFVFSGWFWAATCAGQELEGLQPSIFSARMVDAKTIEFTWYTEKTIRVEKSAVIDAKVKRTMYAKDDEGKLSMDSVTEIKPKTVNYSDEERLREVIRSTVKIDQLTVYGMDGEEISPETLPPLLEQPTPVVVSSNGRIVDPFYLSIFKEGTLIFISRDPAFPTAVSRPLPPPDDADKQVSPSDPG
jgi:hypothetical protein